MWVGVGLCFVLLGYGCLGLGREKGKIVTVAQHISWSHSIHNLPPPPGLDGTVPCKIMCLKALDKKILLVLGVLEDFMTKSSLAVDPLMTDDT